MNHRLLSLVGLIVTVLALTGALLGLTGLAAASELGAAEAPQATVNVCTLPNQRIDAGDLSYEGDDIVVSGCQGMINGVHSFNSLTVSGGTLVHSPTFTTTATTGLHLTITANVNIATNGAINLIGQGYPGGTFFGIGTGGGPGGGANACNNDAGCGGAHAGLGGAVFDFYGNWYGGGVAYGDAYRPQTFGSGGGRCVANAFCNDGYGGGGGGAVRLKVGGSLTVDGALWVDGEAGHAFNSSIPGGGGAGGSVWLDVASLAGSGSISANGGNGVDVGRAGMGGGGGRIAIYYSSNTFTGTVTAQAGRSFQQIMGGAGTIYLRDKGQPAGQMIIANRLPEGTASPPPAGSTPLDGGLVTASDAHDYTYFDISGLAAVRTAQPLTVSLGSSPSPGIWTIDGGLEATGVTLGAGLTLSASHGSSSFAGLLSMDPGQDLLVGQGARLDLQQPLVVDEVIIQGAGSRLGHVAPAGPIYPTLTISATTITIGSGSSINVGARGYAGAPAGSSAPGSGPGGGQPASLHGSGAGYGGPGGGPGGGPTYGTLLQPVDLGSGGSAGRGGGGSTLGRGGNGGGRIHLVVTGDLTVDGAILTRGGAGEDKDRDGGGGSGGSTWIEAGSLGGSGTLDAQGGRSWNSGGGGGGGRIAIYTQNNNFNGTISVAGGSGGGGNGQLGTVYPDDLFSVNASANPDPAETGQLLTYTLQVNNYSTAALTATITNTLPAGVTPGGQEVWNTTIAGGTTWSEVVTVTVTASPGQSLSNLLEVSGNGAQRSFLLQTPVQDAPISGLAVTNDSPTLDTLPVNFNASVSGGSNVSFAWDFGDGASGTGAFIDHIYPGPGSYTATVTASNGASSLQASTPVSVTTLPNFRGLVWHDLDGDGLPGAGEPGLNGATITADGPGGVLSDSSGTDGWWQIDSTTAGLFSLNASLAGYSLTTAAPIQVPLPAQGAAAVNFGMVQPPPAGFGQIAGRAFDDGDGDGHYDPDEPGLAGVTISLYSGGTLVNTTATASGGLYAFNNLPPGIYQLSAAAPAGLYPLAFNSGDVSLAAGQVASTMFGFVGGGQLVGTVVNGNGTPIPGVTLVLIDSSPVNTAATDGNGHYGFPSLAPGDYELQIIPPAEYLIAGSQDTRPVTILGNSQTSEDWTLLRRGRLRLRTFLGGQVPFVPVGGITLIISGTNGSSTTVQTGGDGQAIVDGLQPGSYLIYPPLADLPAGASANPSSRTAAITLDSSYQLDFFIDLARSIRYRCERWTTSSEPHGPAFPCLVNATVISGTAGPPGTIVASAALNGQGSGVFTDLISGTYQVTIEPDPTVTGQASWPVHQEVVNLGDGDHRVVAYPYNPTAGTLSIHGYVFYDRNQNGSRQLSLDEGNDSAANGLTVSLLAADGTLVTTTATGTNATYGSGYYEFTNLAPATYQVVISLRTGLLPTTPTTLQRVVNAVSPPEEAIFGYVKEFGADVGGRVYADANANSQFEPATDTAISGATLVLYDWTGTVVNTAATSSQGSYSFYPLPSGEYTVELIPPAGSQYVTNLIRPVSVPTGGSSAVVNYALISDDDRVRVLVYVDQNFDGQPGTNEALAGVDVQINYAACNQPVAPGDTEVASTGSDGMAIFFPRPLTSGCLHVLPDSLPPGISLATPNRWAAPAGGGFVTIRLLPAATLTVQPFWDLNGNGARNGSEPLVAGASVAVTGYGYQTSSGQGATFMLAAGSYQVTVSPPNNMSVAVSQPLVASLASGGSAQLAVPLRYAGQIAGVLQSSGSSPTWSSLQVILEDLVNGTTQNATVYSWNNDYAFTNVAPSTYRLKLANAPAGWVLQSEPIFTYPAGGTVVQNLTLVRLGEVSGQVYIDNNGNGHKSTGEPVTGQHDVTLVNNAGLPPVTIDVPADGTFTFPNLQPGVQYAVTIDLGTYGYGSPGIAITENPGWFTASSAGLDVSIGIFPHPWSSQGSQYNSVFGRVYEQVGNVLNPHAGALVGYYDWNDNLGCDYSGTVLGATVSDPDGYYRLLTDFQPFTQRYYCIKVLDLPGFNQVLELVSPYSYYYQSTNGLVFYPAVDEIDLVVAPNGSTHAAGGPAVNWSAFRDDNGNSLRDGDEPPLPGVILSSGTISSSSGLDGSGILAGLAPGLTTLAVSPPDGYVLAGPVSHTLWLSSTNLSLGGLAFRPEGWFVGSVFVDNDGDGWRGTDENGLGGVTITLDGPVLTNTVTALDGTFALAGLPDGSYTLSTAAPAGFGQPADQVVTLQDGGQAQVGLQATGQINGVIYHDWDGDGRRLPAEPLLTFPLTMTLDNGATTNLAAGQFLFWDVADGSYTVTVQYGPVQENVVNLDSSGGGALALPAVPANVVRGALWLDGNGDGLRQPWEAPLSGIPVQLAGLAATQSDATGHFQFLGVVTGTYTVTALLPEELGTLPVVVEVDGLRGAAAGLPAVLNQAPVANAGPDQTVITGAIVTLDGSGSFDPEGQALAYQWVQISGPTVILSDDQSATPTFTAPAKADVLTFSLIVTDIYGRVSLADIVTITVEESAVNYQIYLPVIIEP